MSEATAMPSGVDASGPNCAGAAEMSPPLGGGGMVMFPPALVTRSDVGFPATPEYSDSVLVSVAFVVISTVRRTMPNASSADAVTTWYSTIRLPMRMLVMVMRDASIPSMPAMSRTSPDCKIDHAVALSEML